MAKMRAIAKKDDGIWTCGMCGDELVNWQDLFRGIDNGVFCWNFSCRAHNIGVPRDELYRMTLETLVTFDKNGYARFLEPEGKNG